MGQAKQRGNFEERKRQSIEERKRQSIHLAEVVRLERERKAQEWWDALTPEQQEEELEKRRKRKVTMSSMGVLPLLAIGMAMAASGPLHPRRIRARR